jgi:hypothetical protein
MCATREMKRAVRSVSTVGWMLFAILIPAIAQNTATDKTPVSVKRVITNDGMVNNLVEAGIGNRIRVEIDKLKEAVDKGQLDPQKLVLYLDGLELKGLYGTPINVADGVVEYKIERTEQAKAEWNALLGSSKHPFREVAVTVGPENGQGFPPLDPHSPPTMKLRVYYLGWLIGVSIVFGLCLLLFVRRATKSTMLRDARANPLPKGTLPPYSLARVQMAFWFFLVLGSFIYIYLITGDYNTITEQALILIGIGTGTALAAAAIDSTKQPPAGETHAALEGDRETLNREIAELRAKQQTLSAIQPPTPEGLAVLKSVIDELATKTSQRDALDKQIEATPPPPMASERFLADLLSDANGPSFHRFQLLVWTIVLGVLFIIGVYKTLAMPEFSTTLLTLMGISSGAYLGFKIPESQS